MSAPDVAEQLDGFTFELLLDQAFDTIDSAREHAAKNLAVPRPDDLPWPEFISHRRNRYGTWQTILHCPGSCDKVYGITPALHPHNKYDPACNMPECDSYDINRDVMTLLALGEIDGIHTEEDNS